MKNDRETLRRPQTTISLPEIRNHVTARESTVPVQLAEFFFFKLLSAPKLSPVFTVIKVVAAKSEKPDGKLHQRELFCFVFQGKIVFAAQ